MQPESIAFLIAFALPFVQALVQRYIELTENQKLSLAFGLSLAVVLVLAFVQNGFSVEYIITNWGIIFGTAQAVYNIVNTITKLPTKIENRYTKDR